MVVGIDKVIGSGYCGEPVASCNVLSGITVGHIHPVAGQRDGIGHINKIGSLASAELKNYSTVEDKIGY